MKKIKPIQDKLNNRLRKCLKYKTPYETMEENNQFKKEIKYLLSDILKVEENKKAECSAGVWLFGGVEFIDDEVVFNWFCWTGKDVDDVDKNWL